MFRQEFRVATLPVEEFNASEHWAHKFLWRSKPEEDNIDCDQVSVWYTATFSDEELDQLKKEGKIAVYERNK